ncbi:MAG: hypothetical protein ABR543_17395 [Gemmatimonadaceae bacterium]
MTATQATLAVANAEANDESPPVLGLNAKFMIERLAAPMEIIAAARFRARLALGRKTGGAVID